MNEGDDLNNQNEADSVSAKKKSNRYIFAIIVLSAVLVISVFITIWALFLRDTKPALAPDYAPQQSETYAEKIENEDKDDNEKLPQQQGGGAVSLTYSKEVEISLSENKAKLMFANPSKSNQNMLLQIVIQDEVILQSGLISPGYQVKSLELFDSVKLSEGNYEGKFVIYYYQKDIGEKAMLNTEIPLQISVKN